MSRIKQLFKSFAGAVVIALAIFLLLPSTEVQAGYDFVEGDPTAKGSTEIKGGPQWDRSGVIFYLVDEYGHSVGPKPVCYTTSYEGFVDRNGRKIDDSNIRIMSRLLLVKPSKIGVGAVDKWGPPWDAAGNLRGIEIREWLLSTSDGGHTRAAWLIAEEFGQEYAEKWENKELYLVFESIGWNNVYCLGRNMGLMIAGTNHVWGGYQWYLEQNGKTSPTGDSQVNKYTNNIYQHAFILTGQPETTKMGFTAAVSTGGLVTNDVSRHYMNGLGVGVVWNEVQAINTYSPSQGSPGKAEDPHPDKIGQCTIIKGYYTENLDTGVKTSDGVYVQKETTNKIMISDEPEYKVVSWSTSPVESNPNPVNWAPPSPTQSGTHAQSVELKTPEKVLYVLLFKQ